MLGTENMKAEEQRTNESELNWSVKEHPPWETVSEDVLIEIFSRTPRSDWMAIGRTCKVGNRF